MNTKTVVVIGCGATGVTFIRSFIESCIAIKLNGINLVIFEPAHTAGVGLAYQEDMNVLLINRPAETMSAHPEHLNEFLEWLKKRKNMLAADGIEIEPSQATHPSRKTFGCYLIEILEESIHIAAHYNISVKVIREKVTQIHEEQPLMIETENNKYYLADYIVLATGNNQPKDYYNLKNTPKYIHSPYPTHEKLQTISAHETIGIIGNSLTATDITLALRNLHHHAKITMLSRTHFYPRVRGSTSLHQLNFLTALAVQQIKMKKNVFTLRDALRLFRKELKQYNISWKFLFAENNQNKTFAAFLSDEIELAKQKRKWQALLSATNQVIEQIWQALDFQSKIFFLDHFHCHWLRNRSPIPLKNADLLLELVHQEKLIHIPGLLNIEYDHIAQKYIGSSKKNGAIAFDWIINATGPSRYVQVEDELLYNLIQQGLAREHLLGGLDIDFDSAALINADGNLNPHIRLLGHNTAGVYYYISSLEMIAKKAASVASHLVHTIKEDHHHVQTRMDNATYANCPSHFA